MSHSADVQSLLEQLHSQSTRSRAIVELIELNSPDANAALYTLIQDISLGQYYIYAIMALSQRNLINPLPYIRRLFDMQDDMLYTDNHLAGIILLQDYPDNPDTLPVLEVALKRYHDEEFWQSCILQTLVHVNTDEAIYLVAQTMKQHETIEMRAAAATELGESSNPKACEVILNFLEHDHPEGMYALVCAALEALDKQIRSFSREDQIERILPVCKRWLYAGYIPARSLLEGLDNPQSRQIIEEWELWSLVYSP